MDYLTEIAIRDARQRIGSTPVACARWLLDFCRLENIQSLSQGERFKLRLEFATFFMVGKLVTTAAGKWSWKNLPYKEEIEKIRRTLNQQLEFLKKGQVWGFSVVRQARIEDGKLKVRTFPQSQRKVARFIEIAQNTLAEAAPYFGLCANENCGRPLIRTKRRAYCSTRCRDTVNKRKYRERHP